MRKVGTTKGSAAPSPVPGSTSESAGGEAMRRTGSGGGGRLPNNWYTHGSSHSAGPRIASALPSRKDSPIPRNDPSVPGTPGRPAGKGFNVPEQAHSLTSFCSSTILPHIICQHDNHITKLRAYKPTTDTCNHKPALPLPKT
jgi:hypothetical protein